MGSYLRTNQCKFILAHLITSKIVPFSIHFVQSNPFEKTTQFQVCLPQSNMLNEFLLKVI